MTSYHETYVCSHSLIASLSVLSSDFVFLSFRVDSLHYGSFLIVMRFTYSMDEWSYLSLLDDYALKTFLYHHGASETNLMDSSTLLCEYY